MIHTILSEATWMTQSRRHQARLDPILKPYLKKRSTGQKQPVMDFLFEYYRFRPSQLLRWHPGFGVALQGSQAHSFLENPRYGRTPEGITLLPERFPVHRIRSLRWVCHLLQQTASRKPFYGCAGMHEWAMVYRTEHPRHALPLRLSPEAIARVVETYPIRCSHYDAFRFFTPEARPLNQLQPERSRIPELEQPACLHANMDLYRWAYTFYPWVGSDLIADTFALACRIREIDMRASPYDLREQGYPPIPVETPEGRRTYAEYQQQFYEEARPLRERLLSTLTYLLHHVEASLKIKTLQDRDTPG